MDNKIVIFIIFIVYGQQKYGFDGFCGLWATKTYYTNKSDSFVIRVRLFHFVEKHTFEKCYYMNEKKPIVVLNNMFIFATK